MLGIRTFAEEHIPNSIFIGIDGSFAPWVGTIVEDVTKPILLVTPMIELKKLQDWHA